MIPSRNKYLSNLCFGQVVSKSRESYELQTVWTYIGRAEYLVKVVFYKKPDFCLI